MQLLFLSIAECSAAQAGWSLRRCTQLTWLSQGAERYYQGGTCKPNSSNAAGTAVMADSELKLLFAQFRHPYLSAIPLLEEELRGAVSPGRIASGQQILLD